MDTLKDIIKYTIKKNDIEYSSQNIPKDLKEYLDRVEYIIYKKYYEIKCGLCGEIDQFCDDYTSKYMKHYCGYCDIAILCFNVNNYKDKTCCQEETDDIIKCYPIIIEYEINDIDEMNEEDFKKICDKYDNESKWNSLCDFLDNKEFLNSKETFNDEEEFFLNRFMKYDDLKDKYRVKNPEINICENDVGYIFIGRCTNCKKLRFGMLWSD